MKNILTTPALTLFLLGAGVTAQDKRPNSAGPMVESVAEAAADAADESFEEYRTKRVTPIDYSDLLAKGVDYPIEAWNAGEEGGVSYKLTVNALGQPTDCIITESSGSVALDKKTCEILMMRARFDPAHNDAGQAIAGTYVDKMRWRKREPEFSGTFRVTVEFIVDEQGVTKDCRIIEKSGAISTSTMKSLEKRPCPGTNRPGRYVYRDENGVPVAKRVRMDFHITVDDLEE